MFFIGDDSVGDTGDSVGMWEGVSCSKRNQTWTCIARVKRGEEEQTILEGEKVIRVINELCVIHH